MLYIISNDIQTGKTRWLEGVVDRLSADGVRVDGVIAPGVWIEHDAGENEPSVTFEKVGITNVLLPQGECILFARRKDLAVADGSYEKCSQSAAMGMGWAIDETAIAQVNRHLCTLKSNGSDPSVEPGLLVIDELGRIELERGGGLTAGIEIIENGATAAHPHALIVIRSRLLDIALDRFADAPWGGVRVIAPDEDGERDVRGAFGL